MDTELSHASAPRQGHQRVSGVARDERRDERRHRERRRVGNARRCEASGAYRESAPVGAAKAVRTGKIIVGRRLAPSKRSKVLGFRGHIRRDLTVRKISKGFRMNSRRGDFSSLKQSATHLSVSSRKMGRASYNSTQGAINERLVHGDVVDLFRGIGGVRVDGVLPQLTNRPAFARAAQDVHHQTTTRKQRVNINLSLSAAFTRPIADALLRPC